MLKSSSQLCKISPHNLFMANHGKRSNNNSYNSSHLFVTCFRSTILQLSFGYEVTNRYFKIFYYPLLDPLHDLVKHIAKAATNQGRSITVAIRQPHSNVTQDTSRALVLSVGRSAQTDAHTALTTNKSNITEL